MLADSSLSTILVLLETLGGAVQEEKEALEKNPQMSKAKLESYQKLFYILESQTKIHEVLEIVFSTEDEEGFLLEYIPLAIKILNCFTFYSQEISGFSFFFAENQKISSSNLLFFCRFFMETLPKTLQIC